MNVMNLWSDQTKVLILSTPARSMESLKQSVQSYRPVWLSNHPGLPSLEVTCEIKLFQIYFSLRRRLFEIILFQRMETCLKLFQNYFSGLLQLTNIIQLVQCR